MLKYSNKFRNIINQKISIIIWVLSALLAYDFLLHGWRKLDPEGWWAPAFAKWGYPTWFMIFIGVIELFGGALLLIPKTRPIGAILLTLVIVGAFITKSVHKIGVEEILFFISTLTTLLLLFAYRYNPPKNK